MISSEINGGIPGRNTGFHYDQVDQGGPDGSGVATPQGPEKIPAQPTTNVNPVAEQTEDPVKKPTTPQRPRNAIPWAESGDDMYS